MPGSARRLKASPLLNKQWARYPLHHSYASAQIPASPKQSVCSAYQPRTGTLHPSLVEWPTDRSIEKEPTSHLQSKTRKNNKDHREKDKEEKIEKFKYNSRFEQKGGVKAPPPKKTPITSRRSPSCPSNLHTSDRTTRGDQGPLRNKITSRRPPPCPPKPKISSRRRQRQGSAATPSPPPPPRLLWSPSLAV